ATDRTRLAQFLARGGGLYLTGERSCCQRLNDSVQSLLRPWVSGGDSSGVGGLNEFLTPAAFNPTARGGITKGLTLWFPNGPGEIFNISGANVLATIGEAIVAGVWSGADLKGNAGRIVLMMDINWLSDAVSRGQCNDDCRRAILANLLAFLDDPAGPLVLSAPLLAAPLFGPVDETPSTQTSFFDLPRLSITSTSLDPLFRFSGSTLTTAGVFARMTESTIATAGSFLRLDSGARITQTGTDPL